MAINMFLKLSTPDIKGEATGSEHQDQIHVLSWGHSFNLPTSSTRSAGGGTVEQANHADLSITKYTDTASIDLLKMCWSGRRIGKGVLSVYRSANDGGMVKYLEVTMENIIVSNISIGGGAGDLPTETVTLSYGTVHYKYIQQKEGSPGGVAQTVKHNLTKQEVS